MIDIKSYSFLGFSSMQYTKMSNLGIAFFLTSIISYFSAAVPKNFYLGREAIVS